MSAHKFVKATGAPSKCDVCGKTRNATAHRKATIDAQATTVAEARKDLLPEVNALVDDAEIADALEAAGITVEQAESDSAMEAEMDEEAEVLGNQVDAKGDESWGIPPVPDFVPSTDDEVETRVAQGETREDAEHEAAKVEAKPAKKAAAKKAAPAKKVNNTPAKKADGEPTASLWVGWRITNAAVLDDTTVAAKLKAAKPTGDLDRTVKLTKAELQTLDAVATKFMEPGHTGPEIYSGRALRGRIAAAIAKIDESGK